MYRDGLDAFDVSETDIERMRTEDLLSGMETEDVEATNNLFRNLSSPYHIDSYSGRNDSSDHSNLGPNSSHRAPELPQAQSTSYGSINSQNLLLDSPVLAHRQRKRYSSYPFKQARGPNFESLDYDPIPNSVFEKEVLANTEQSHDRDARIRWFMTLVIGVMVGALAFCLDWAVGQLRAGKVLSVISAWRSADGGYFLPLGVMLAVALFYGLIASILVAFVEPIAGGKAHFLPLHILLSVTGLVPMSSM
tara:strand:- start:299 stop:1045 length:747 start_codon:yes stop_codon:yes gene_type:complete